MNKAVAPCMLIETVSLIIPLWVSSVHYGTLLHLNNRSIWQVYLITNWKYLYNYSG